MKFSKKNIFHIIAFILVILALFVHLNNLYETELKVVLKKMIPTVATANFTFFSGDRDVTNNVNYPTTIFLELKDGDTFSGTFIAKNHKSNKKPFSLNVEPFSFSDDDRPGNAGHPPLPELKFLHDKEFALEAEDLEIIKYSINIPENTKYGKYKTVASLVETSLHDFQPAIGISITIDVSTNPAYHEYAALITKEPYSIARQIVIFESKKILTILLAIISLVFLYIYLKTSFTGKP